MNVQAIAKNIRISPRKVRLVADAVRKMTVIDATRILDAADQQAARPITKVLQSALANAVNNAKLDRANMVIERIEVNDGQSFKRFRPSTRGRIHPYKKRGSTIRVILGEKVVSPVVVKAKAEPKVEEKKVEDPKAEGRGKTKGGKK